MSFEVKVRNWWKLNPDWPNGLEPAPGDWRTSYKVGTYKTEEEAREAAQDWNATHKPGRLSRKAEFSEL
jgi:hypothetical protein